MLTGDEIQIIRDEIRTHEKARAAAYDKMIKHDTLAKALMEKLEKEDVPYDLMADH